MHALKLIGDNLISCSRWKLIDNTKKNIFLLKNKKPGKFSQKQNLTQNSHDQWLHNSRNSSLICISEWNPQKNAETQKHWWTRIWGAKMSSLVVLSSCLHFGCCLVQRITHTKKIIKSFLSLSINLRKTFHSLRRCSTFSLWLSTNSD